MSARHGSIPYSFFNKLFTQQKTYGDDCASNSGFDSEGHINNILPNCCLVSTSKDFTTRNLYIESLKELLAAAWEYVAEGRNHTPDKPDPTDLLHMELEV